jgi:hypothetical protein
VLGGCGGGGTMPLTNGGGGNIGGGGSGGGANRSAKDKIVTAVQTGFSTYKTGKGSRRKRITRGEDPTPKVVYDDFYELWARQTPEENYTRLIEYFEDEACTLPAGESRYDKVYADNGGEFKATGYINVTAGPKAGTTGTSNVDLVYTPEFLYTFSFIQDIPGFASSSIIGRWDSTRGGYKTYSKDIEGNVTRYESTYKNDGTSRLVFTDENGLEFTLNFLADQSGTGTVTGKDTTLLPASIVWDANGSGTITFKDGSTETFENFQFRKS